jgi:hypothetical protein
LKCLSICPKISPKPLKSRLRIFFKKAYCPPTQLKKEAPLHLGYFF